MRLINDHWTSIAPLQTSSQSNVKKQPGHWVLASLGKRVLRPGGLELTRQLIGRLRPGPRDHVVEFAPGLGVTARLTLAGRPCTYIGVEREESMARKLRSELGSSTVQIIAASAESSGLASESATVVYGEAMLSMQTPEQKIRILAEAFRLLKPGGRFGIHELALLPDEIEQPTRKAIEREMSMSIHVGVRPATLGEWKHLLEEVGFYVEWQTTAPMHLLEPKRMLTDEGFMRMVRIAFNLLRKPDARSRVLSMRRMFRRYASHLTAVAMVGTKRAE